MDWQQVIDEAIREDVGSGDHTSLACIPEEAISKAHLIAKQPGILAGVALGKQIFHTVDPELNVVIHKTDGDTVQVKDLVLEVSGSSQNILKAERLALNFMQRMSGIATTTQQYVKETEGYKANILDTRKTTPLLRSFEKEAVKLGGGVNHRMGLYDMIMIKDNHIAFAGGIEEAIRATLKYLLKNDLSLKVEIETTSLDEIKEVMRVGGVDRIMIDNFTPEQAKIAVELIGGEYETEISGGVTLETVRAYAASGVDYISVGALTHSYTSLDLSLKAVS